MPSEGLPLTRSLGQSMSDLSPNQLPDEAMRVAPVASVCDRVTMKLADRRCLAGEPVARATGHPASPLSGQQLAEKFADCVEAGGSPIAADVLFGRLSALPSIMARDLTARR